GVERAHALLAAIDEALLVEHAVGRQEHFAVHVTDLGSLVTQRHVQAGIVNVILELFVESDDDVDRGSLVRGGEIAHQCARGDRELLHAAFDEVAGGRGLGKDDQVRLRIELRRLAHDRADARDVVGVLAFGWPELGQGNADYGHAGKIRRYGGGRRR